MEKNQSYHIGPYIKLINDCLEKSVNHDAKKFDLTMAQMRVLGFLNQRNGAKTSQRDIENYLEVSHPTVIGILKRLEAKGFIRSETDVEDKRVKNIILLEKEAEVHDRMETSKLEMETKLIRNMTAEQVEQMVSLLKIVYQNVQNW